MRIKIGFSRHKGFAPLSWAIMLVEQTNFSHAYIRVHSDSLNRDLIYQATGIGVNFVGVEVFDESAQVVEEYEIEISDTQRVKLLQWAIDNAGKPYGKLQCLGLGLKRIASRFGIQIKNPFTNGNRAFVCCELAAKALEEFDNIPSEADLDQIGLIETRAMVRSVAVLDEKGQT